MTFTVTNSIPRPQTLICPDCNGNRFRVGSNKVECTNCGWKESGGTGGNKFGAKRTLSKDGLKRDSKYEAEVADELLLRKKVGDILDYDTQFKCEMWAYDQNGKKAMKKTHKVDFRIHHRDGSFELLEAKGVETQDYKDRRRWLETFWLPFNLDHTYSVVKQNTNYRSLKNGRK